MEPQKDAAGAPVHSIVHTPGPWKVPKRFEIYQDLGPNVGGSYIGTTAGNSVLPESIAMVDEANARLIAAAPDLLEACRDMIEAMNDYECSVDDPPTPKNREMMLRAMSAVEKATFQVV